MVGVAPRRDRETWAIRNRVALVETLLLGGTGAMLLFKAWQGALAFYLHPRYAPLVVGGGALLLLLAAMRAGGIARAGDGVGGVRWPGYLLVALPLLIGVAVPARPLGAEAFTEAPAEVSQPGQGPIPLDGDPGDWDLLQWGTALAIGREGLDAQAVDLIGFVYHNPERPFDGFVVGRYAIICCIADVKGIGVPVVWPGGAAIPANSWVRVRGQLGRADINGRSTRAFIATAIETVPQPTDPYIYR